MKRRMFLLSGTAAALLATRTQAADGPFEITRTEAQWRAMLTDTEYDVMRREKTERAGSSPLNAEKRDGIYACKGCDLPLYDAATKFESGTGWPSFFSAPCPMPLAPKRTNRSFLPAQRCIAAAAAATLAISLTTGRNPRANAIASTASA